MPERIKLFTGAGAAGLAVHWMLLELEIPFDLVLLDVDQGEHRLPEYLALNPSGRVPALSIDGQIYLESTALLMLLAEMYPEKKFAPLAGERGRAEYLQWMVYLANALLPAFRAWFYADGGESEKEADIIKQSARRQIELCFDNIDKHLADGRRFVLGDTITVADFLLTMLLRWSRKMPKPSETWLYLANYQNDIRQNPYLREVHRREALSDWIGDAAKHS